MNQRVRGATASRLRSCAAPLAAAAVAFAASAQAQSAPEAASAAAARELGELSIDELAQISVTSVSKRPETLSQAASAVHVITPDAIRRSGALSLPEALRLAPNLEVMRIDAVDHTVTARGFAGFESANKLLVLLDGRSVWTPLFSGVEWDQHHTILDDIDRIEVISGPGGVLWGANAVNGVVSVTSKSAFDTRGVLAVATAGTVDSDLRLRLGSQIGEAAAGRVYATGYRRGNLRRANGREANDGWEGWQAGFRTDWAGDRDTLTLQGDVLRNSIDESFGVRDEYVRGGNLLGRWTRRLQGSTFEVQAYYDQNARELRRLNSELRTGDVQAQHSFTRGPHNVVWGAGYRLTRDYVRTLDEPQLIQPHRRQVGIGNIFVQDGIVLSPDLMLTLGVKLETNSYTSTEWLPSARFGWRLNDRQFVWGAVSRVVRNPSRIERDFTIAGFVEPGLMGSEKLVAYELGYRGRLTDVASVSANLFYHDYDELRTNELVPGRSPPVFVGNTMEGESWGLEAWGDLQVAHWWRLSVGGTILEKDFRLKTGSFDVARFEATGADPNYWAKLHSHMRLSARVDLDVFLRRYGEVPRLLASGYVGTPAYTEANLRLAWRVSDELELSLTGLNLLNDQHPEGSEARRNEVPRSAHVTLRWAR